MQDKPLLEVTVVTDDSTGIWNSGEVECNIHVARLENYLKCHKLKGRDEVVRMLAYLIHNVYERFDEIHNGVKESSMIKKGG